MLGPSYSISRHRFPSPPCTLRFPGSNRCGKRCSDHFSERNGRSRPMWPIWWGSQRSNTMRIRYMVKKIMVVTCSNTWLKNLGLKTMYLPICGKRRASHMSDGPICVGSADLLAFASFVLKRSGCFIFPTCFDRRALKNTWVWERVFH